MGRKLIISLSPSKNTRLFGKFLRARLRTFYKHQEHNNRKQKPKRLSPRQHYLKVQISQMQCSVRGPDEKTTPGTRANRSILCQVSRLSSTSSSLACGACLEKYEEPLYSTIRSRQRQKTKGVRGSGSSRTHCPV